MPGLKKVRYEKKCDECGSPFVASMKNARFCSGACKARWSREHKKSIIKSQAELIKVQRKIFSSVIPDSGAAAVDQKKVQSISNQLWNSLLGEFTSMKKACEDRARKNNESEYAWGRYVTQDEDRRFKEIWPIIKDCCCGRIKIIR